MMLLTKKDILNLVPTLLIYSAIRVLMKQRADIGKPTCYKSAMDEFLGGSGE